MTPKSEETDTARVEVIQADEDAAADYFEATRGERPTYCRDTVLAEMFARHRLAQASPADEVGDGKHGVPAFLAAIMEQSPRGETVQVKYHPNGDWTVYDRISSAASAGVRDAGREAERDAVLDILMPLHWEIWKTALFDSRLDWPDDDEQECIARQVDEIAVLEHADAWVKPAADKILAALTARPDGGSVAIRVNGEPATDADVIAIGRQMDAEDGGYPSPTATGGADREVEIDLMQMARDAAASTRPNSPWAKAVAKGLRDDNDEVRAAMAGIAAHRATLTKDASHG